MNFQTGYFTDPLNGIAERIEAGPPATSTIELSPIRHDFKPTTTQDILVAGPYGIEAVRPGIGAKLHHTGGGMHRISIPFHARRYSRGDAEKYLSDMLIRFGRTDLGELSVHGKAYSNCWFVSGEGSIAHAWTNSTIDTEDTANHARFHVKGTLNFVRGLPPFATLPDATYPVPNERPDYLLNNDGDYKSTIAEGPFIGRETKIGRFCDLQSVSVERAVLAVTIPRCDGVRIVGRGHTNPDIASQLDYRRGRTINLSFRGFVRCYEQNDGMADPPPEDFDGRTNPSRLVCERRILELQLALRGQRMTLQGNGNTFTDCFLLSLAPDDDPECYTSLYFTARFEQEYNEIAVFT